MVAVDPLATAEQYARINNLMADTLEKEARTRRLPWQVFAAAFTAGAAMAGAIAGFVAPMLRT